MYDANSAFKMLWFSLNINTNYEHMKVTELSPSYNIFRNWGIRSVGDWVYFCVFVCVSVCACVCVVREREAGVLRKNIRIAWLKLILVIYDV